MLRSPDRRARASEELAKTSFDWQFLDAVDGKLLAFPISEYDSEKVENLLGYPLMPGELGAFLSHRKCWQACVDQNKPTLIFEDDFILFPQFKSIVDYLLTDFQDWDVMRLQALTHSPYTEIRHVKDGASEFSIAENAIDALGCTAYLIKPSAAQKLLDCSRSIYEPIDHYIEHRARHGLKFLAIRPYPSDISQTPTTVYRPDRPPIRGFKKLRRSVLRWLDRAISKDPWFPR